MPRRCRPPKRSARATGTSTCLGCAHDPRALWEAPARRRRRGAAARCRRSRPPRGGARPAAANAAAASSMPAPAPRRASACRTAPNCRRPSTGRASALVLLIAGGDDGADANASRMRRGRSRRRDASDSRRAASEATTCVLGLAASGGTPFTCAVLRRGGTRGARSPIGIANAAGAPLLAAAAHPISGRNRRRADRRLDALQAGTAQKVVLNLLLHAGDDAARPRLSRPDGRHAADEREAERAPCAWCGSLPTPRRPSTRPRRETRCREPTGA